MESHTSCEKLVAAEAGLMVPNFIDNVPIGRNIPRPNRSPNKLTNYLLISVVTVLLMIISYEIWQAVRREQLVKEFEADNLPVPVEQLPLISENTRIQDMVEELKKVKSKLEELQEKINRRDSTSTTTELPITTSSELTADEMMENLERDLVKQILEASINDGAKSSISNELISETVDSPEYTIIEKQIIQDIGKSDSSESVILTDPIDENESGSLWSLSFYFGKQSGDNETSEEFNVTEGKETEATSSEDGWNIYLPGEISNPFTYTWIWGFSSADEEDSKSSESGENVEEKIDSVEIETVKSQEETTTEQSSEIYGDYSYYENDDLAANSYEYTSWLRDNFLYFESEDPNLEESTTESVLSSTENQDEVKTQESVTTEAPVSSSTASQTSESSSEYGLEDHKESYNLGSPTDQFWEFLTTGASPYGEDVEDGSSSSGVGSEDSLEGDDQSELHASIDAYLEKLFRQRLAEAEYLSQQYARIEKDEEFGTQYDTEDWADALESIANIHSPSTSEEWSYISKRSVDTPTEIDTSGRYLTSKELGHKMALIQQAIDDDNHLLQNEVSLTPEPMRDILQIKLNNFFGKMEAVSAHIDRLHERYLRLNELDDDYVSQEFPPEEFDTPGNSDY